MTADHEPRPATPATIALLAVPENSPAVLYSLHEVFSSVGSAWQMLTGEPNGGRRIRPLIVAEETEPFAGAMGLPIAPDARFAEAPLPDAVIVGDLAMDMAIDPHGHWPAASAWLRTCFEAGATVCSVCTGSVMLAEAGLLDGVEATTHWGACQVFERHYPAVILHPERILVPAGPEQRVITSGGVASWSDLALYLIARFCGRAEAVRIAKVFLLGDRSDGQLPFAAMARPLRHGDAVIAESQTWIADHYALPNAVSEMVTHSGLTPRTFKRRFRKATGYTPIEYVQTVRVEEAKQILEMTAEPTDAVGASVGYEDPASFRRIFKRLTGITPARYRQRFRGVGALPV
jgi:transcriptional regulator GlxA family with amidase domain